MEGKHIVTRYSDNTKMEPAQCIVPSTPAHVFSAQWLTAEGLSSKVATISSGMLVKMPSKSKPFEIVDTARTAMHRIPCCLPSFRTVTGIYLPGTVLRAHCLVKPLKIASITTSHPGFFNKST